MSIIVPPPKLDQIISDPGNIAKVINAVQKPEIQALLKKANDEYLYWSEILYRMPSGIEVKAEEVWAYLKFGRIANRKPAPIRDKNNRPFTYWIPDCLLRDISEVDRRSGGRIITDQPDGFPSTERYIVNSLMDEAIASSQLEGATTESRVAKEMLRSGRKPTDKNEQMIFNNWKAIQYIRDNVDKKLSLSRLFELQAILTQDTLEHPEQAGKFRVSDDVFVYYRGELIHVPPKAKSLNDRISRLCDFANVDDEEHWIHPVVKGGMIHFWLAYDHPFVDGNGRTARALMYWYLLSRGYELFKYLSISKHFLRAPGQYVRSYLYTEHDDNDLTYFLIYNLVSVRLALHELAEYLRHKMRETAKANQLLIHFKGLNFRQKALIYHSIQHPDTVYTIEAHKNSQGIAYETARKDLVGLTRKGFLRKERKGKRLFIFLPVGRAIERLRKS